MTIFKLHKKIKAIYFSIYSLFRRNKMFIENNICELYDPKWGRTFTHQKQFYKHLTPFWVSYVFCYWHVVSKKINKT